MQTWRPRASLNSEVHSFFLGGSVRIKKLEELVRTAHGIMDSASERDLVNRFGLETEDAGRINVNLNVVSQDIDSRNEQRKMLRWVKNIQKMETQKLVMQYTLEVEQRKRN